MLWLARLRNLFLLFITYFNIDASINLQSKNVLWIITRWIIFSWQFIHSCSYSKYFLWANYYFSQNMSHTCIGILTGKKTSLTDEQYNFTSPYMPQSCKRHCTKASKIFKHAMSNYKTEAIICQTLILFLLTSNGAELLCCNPNSGKELTSSNSFMSSTKTLHWSVVNSIISMYSSLTLTYRLLNSDSMNLFCCICKHTSLVWIKSAFLKLISLSVPSCCSFFPSRSSFTARKLNSFGWN